jgi:HAD superfamily hydrolase (TIGR01509 family)
MPGVKLSSDQLCADYRGLKLGDTLHALSTRFGVPYTDDYQAVFREHSERLYADELRSFHGVADVLATLPHAKCVASNARKQKMELSLAITGLAHLFGPHLYSAYDVNSWKPDPDLFLAAAAAMGYGSENCIVIEDSEVGIEAAIRANMRCLQHVHARGIAPQHGTEPFWNYAELPKLLNF